MTIHTNHTIWLIRLQLDQTIVGFVGVNSEPIHMGKLKEIRSIGKNDVDTK